MPGKTRYSDSFNESFSFYLNCYRKMDLTFSGTENPRIIFDKNGLDCREVFKLYENGIYKNKHIITKHPHMVFSVIKGKKSWGLHIKMWSDGIREGSFRKQEILDDFDNKRVIIPDNFKKEFFNLIYK